MIKDRRYKRKDKRIRDKANWIFGYV